jgi:hypothetical protein
VAAAVLLTVPLTGCGVVAVAGAAAGAAISVTGAVVSTGVKVTGKVIEKTVDAVGGGSADGASSGGVVVAPLPSEAASDAPR